MIKSVERSLPLPRMRCALPIFVHFWLEAILFAKKTIYQIQSCKNDCLNYTGLSARRFTQEWNLLGRRYLQVLHII